jgi:hypothetical protein
VKWKNGIVPKPSKAMEAFEERAFPFQELLESMNEDPSKSDVGKFIPETKLQEWWRSMQQNHPAIYKADDEMFGKDGAQHARGTKLMAFFDDDPNKPMRVKVLGSRWVKEESFIYPSSDTTRTPMYIVRFKGSSELTQINLGSGHEEGGWSVGWGDIDDDEEEDEDDDVNGEVDVDDEDDVDENDESGYTMRVPKDDKDPAYWNNELDGPISKAFLEHCFTLSEIVVLESGDGLMANLQYRLGTSKLHHAEARAVVMLIVLAWTDDHAGAVILKDQMGKKHQAIEFEDVGKDDYGVPNLRITYGPGLELEEAENFLRGERIKEIQCSDEAAKLVQNHILDHCKGEGLNDIGSGLLLYTGELVPIKPAATMSTVDYLPMIDGQFGVEVEVSCAVGVRPDILAKNVQEHSGITVRERFYSRAYKGGYTNPDSKDVSGSDMQGKDCKDYKGKCLKSGLRTQDHGAWKIVFDRSIQTSQDFRSNTMFEVVSPILCGNAGLEECNLIIKTLTNVCAIQVNKSMGLHVHIDVERLSLQQLIKVCQNFVRYEDAIDTFLDPSRRTGSKESDRYFRSNKNAVAGNIATDLQLEGKLQSCQTMEELCDLMNPNGRYYKLNLQNLKTKRQPTMEFRQHSSTRDSVEVTSWVRFCMALVHNSASLDLAIQNDDSSRTQRREHGFDLLFDSVIQDPALREFYYNRREVYR